MQKLIIGIRDKRVKDYEIDFRDYKYVITSNLEKCDVIASDRLVKLALYKNELVSHNILFDANKACFKLKLMYFHIQCFCVDVRLEYEKYKDKTKVFPIDLNTFE